MPKLTPKQFKKIVAEAIDGIPELYQKYLNNVVFIIEDEPSAEQRQQLKLADGHTLFGLYEGTPLPARGGATKLLPDKITLFKLSLEAISRSTDDLKENVRHTIWHEVAHYYGLDHDRIDELESQ
ncbi:TPA: hypothetical protein DIS56_03565 [Candidatus Saccharibacteria bacterium]|nr:MAG: hypothetical protein A3F05_03910 [Candidatus Saccharibacteria bacterium RIFCSPHIGHO2_12_FULL_47_17]HCM52178.1 hypothetical protein [Candidatus Saccharibacteria bacterium]